MSRIFAIALATALLALLPLAAAAQTCPGNPDALGTARTIEVDVKSTPRVGRKQFPATLPLADKELVLTFDDGPWAATTPKVLDALKHECVQATFFLLGRNAADYPAIARPRIGGRPQPRPSHVFAPFAQPHVARESAGRDRPRHRGG